MSIKQAGKREVVGDLATLGTKYRVNIPVVCMETIKWDLGNSPVELIAELVEHGRVRLHLAGTKRPEILAMLERMQKDTALNRLDLLGAIDDKYYEVNFYTKATHVVDLNERISVFLGVLASDQERKIFVESSTDTIDIMSLAYRNQRIERLKDSIS